MSEILPPVVVSAMAELVPVRTPASQNPALVYLAGLAASSRRTMRAALDEIALLLTDGRCDHLTLPWAALRFQHAQAIRSLLVERNSPATVNRKLAALRGTLTAAKHLLAEHLPTEPEAALRAVLAKEAIDAAIRSLKRVRGEGQEQAAGRALTYGEFMALLGACAADGTIAGDRDAAMITLAYVTGLRRAELAGLMLADIQWQPCTLRVRGKGNKVRTVPVEDDGALSALEDWLHERGPWEGPLFTRILKGGHLQQVGLTDQAIYFILQKRGRQAGVNPFSPHDVRRTFAGELLDANADLVTVQKLMGHSSPQTTAKYDRRGERAKRNAVQKLHAPWRRRR